MSYPDSSTAAFSWQGAVAGAYPNTTLAAFTWGTAIRIAAPSPLGAPAAVLRQVVQIRASAPSPLGVPAAVLSPIAETSFIASAPSPLGVPSAMFRQVSRIMAAAPSPLGAPAALLRQAVQIRASAPSPLGVPAAVIKVIRYELRGEIRDQGVLVNRRVRAYRLSDGALAGEADTVGGQFRVHVGFAPALHYIIPLDMTESATDYAPPSANRVMSVLAED